MLVLGGDLVCFTTERQEERTDQSITTTVDLLMCGNGQWGGLGNNVFRNAQGPLRVKSVSGLIECKCSSICFSPNRSYLQIDNDAKQGLQPIWPHSVAVSPTGHVLLTLNPLSGVRDVRVWGRNHDFELGNGKKSSLPVPTILCGPDGERIMLRMKKAREVRDLSGRVWGRGISVEEHAAVGYGNSVVYWRIVT